MNFIYQLYRLLLFIGVLCLNSLTSSAFAQPRTGNSLRLIATIQNFNAGVLRFSYDSRVLANGARDTIQIWDVQRGQLLRTLHGKKINAPFAFSRDGKTISVCTTDHRVEVWSVTTGTRLKILPGFRTHVSFSTDGTLIAGCSMRGATTDEGVKIWNAQTGRRLRSINRATSENDQFEFSRDNKVLLIASVDDFLKVYDLKSGQFINDVSTGSDISPPITLSPDGKILATIVEGKVLGDDPMPGSDTRPATDSGLPRSFSAKLWNARTGKLIRNFGYWETKFEPTSIIGFTSDCKNIICNVGQKSGYGIGAYVTFFNVASGKELRTMKIENPVLLSPDSRLLVTGKKHLKIWTIQ